MIKARIINFELDDKEDIITVCNKITDPEEESTMVGSELCENFCKFNLMTDSEKNKVLCSYVGGKP